MKVDLITEVEEIRAIAPEWRTLFAESKIPLPFMTCEWVESWWAHMRQDRLTVRDHLNLRTIRTREGQLIAIAPMILTRRPATGPVQVSFLQFFGADPNMTEVRGMLAHPAFEREAYVALARDLETVPCHWIRWSGLPPGGEEALAPRLTLRQESVADLYLELPPSWEEFRSGLKRNIRESLRKCYNSLKREQIAFDIRVARTVQEVEPAVERFFELHRLRSLSEATITHGNVFDSAASRAFLREVIARFADRDEMRIFELVIGGEVVATRLGFQFGDTLYLYYSGYRPEWGPYSVMTTTVAEAIRYAIDAGLRTVNLSTGRDISKTRWGPVEVNYTEGVQIMPSAHARFVYDAYQRGFSLRKYPTIRRLTRTLAR